MFPLSSITFQLTRWQRPWRVKSGMLCFEQLGCSHSLRSMLALRINGHAWHVWQATQQEKGKEGEKGEWRSRLAFPPTPSPLKFAPAVKFPDKEFPRGISPPPPLIYCVVQFQDLYFSWRVTVFLIINYLFNFNLCDGKELVAFNWELVTLGGCKRLHRRSPVLSSLNIVQWPTWRSSEFGRHQKFPPHARKKPPVPRVIKGFMWNTAPTQPQTQPIFFFSENGERVNSSLRSVAVLVGRANKPRRARAVKLRGDMGGISWQYKVCLIYESLVVKTVDNR